RSSLAVNVKIASGSSPASMLNRAMLRQPSGRDGGRRTVVADGCRRVVAGRGPSGAAPVTGTGACCPQPGHSIVRPTNRPVAVSFAPQAQKKRILSSGTGSGAAGRVPHLGQPTELDVVSKASPHGQLTRVTSEVYPLPPGGGGGDFCWVLCAGC